MSSKVRRDLQDNQSPSKRSRAAPKKHLYLVLDDWEKGYSIRKIKMDVLAASDLPEPAAFRFVAPAACSESTLFVAMGSDIVIVTEDAPTLVFDTVAAALAVAPPLPGRPSSGFNVVAGGALYALTTLGAGLPLALEAFSWARCTRDAEEPGRPTHEWSWKSVATPPPPFDGVVSYAVHPDGRTIFVSTRGTGTGTGSTYSLDTTRREWRCHGAWVLPFHGQGCFDRELDAWVGLHEEEDKGYIICACQVASSRSGAPPDSDKLEEKLLCKAGGKATLTYMGDSSRFCLVESVALEDACEVHVTTFGLKFNRKGKLQITSHRTANSYLVSKYVPSFCPAAFCM